MREKVKMSYDLPRRRNVVWALSHNQRFNWSDNVHIRNNIFTILQIKSQVIHLHLSHVKQMYIRHR